MAGVPSSVGDGLLGQAVDRGPDRRAEVVELAGERHLDAGTRLAIGGELLDLGHAGLRRELGVLRGAEHADDGAQLGEGAGRCVLDDGQGLDGTLRVGGRDGTSCLGLDGDARDVVGDGVVEFARELFAFAGLGLVDVTEADLRAIADRGAERGGGQEERVPPDLARQAHGVGDGGDGLPEQDDAEADCGFPTGAPPEQGVGQDERRGRAVQRGAVRPGEDSDEVDDHQRAEGDRNRDERVRASPRQGADDRQRVEQQHRAWCQVPAKHHFHQGPADQCCDQGPVPRPRVRGIRGSRFGPQRAECAGGHPISLGSPRARGIRRKYKSSAVPTARSDQAPGLMCPPPASVKVAAPTRSSQGAL